MYNWLIGFVQKYDIHYCCQFGFRKNHSTCSNASIHLINKLSSATDRHETTAGVFQDLSKAFDTINHQILFGTLYQGPKMWNSLAGSITNSSNYLNFKENTLAFL